MVAGALVRDKDGDCRTWITLYAMAAPTMPMSSTKMNRWLTSGVRAVQAADTTVSGAATACVL